MSKILAEVYNVLKKALHDGRKDIKDPILSKIAPVIERTVVNVMKSYQDYFISAIYVPGPASID